MGGKYEVRGAMSGLCPFWDGQFTNSLAHALLLLIRFSLKYRIIEFNIRKSRWIARTAPTMTALRGFVETASGHDER